MLTCGFLALCSLYFAEFRIIVLALTRVFIHFFETAYIIPSIQSDISFVNLRITLVESKASINSQHTVTFSRGTPSFAASNAFSFRSGNFFFWNRASSWNCWSAVNNILSPPEERFLTGWGSSLLGRRSESKKKLLVREQLPLPVIGPATCNRFVPLTIRQMMIIQGMHNSLGGYV